MNITTFISDNTVFVNCEYIKGYAFKKVLLLVESALLWKATHILMATFALTRGYYAFFQSCNIDCFECLLPDKILAY